MPKTAPTLSPSEFETYLRIAREQKVYAFKLGDLAVQFSAELPGEPGETVAEPTDPYTAGAWKRGPNLNKDSKEDWD